MKDDTISRRAAIDAILEMNTENRVSWLDCALDTLDALPSAEPRWIPVTERLPEYGIDVLTDNGYGEYEINHTIGGGWYLEPVAAWMPLPKPWKGEEG